VPEGPAYETTGGWVMAELGRVPVVGDTVSMPGWEVSVVAMDGMRVDRLRFTPVGEPTGAADGSEAGGAADLGSEGASR
jgi:CBS domain containing-hemolysin-like protein